MCNRFQQYTLRIFGTNSSSDYNYLVEDVNIDIKMVIWIT